MKKNYLIKQLLALGCVMSLALTGCTINAGNTTISASVIGDDSFINGTEYSQVMEDKDIEEGLMNFSFNLFKESMEGNENIVISPISVIYALDMLAAGGEDETQEEILNALCAGTSKEDMLVYAKNYMEKFDEKSNLHLANSVWANEDVIKEALNKEYVSELEEYMNARAEMLPFDNAALDKINKWTSDETDGMIYEILDEIPDNAVLYLINAMAFEGKWDTPYEDYQIDEYGVFTNVNGEHEVAKMLSSKEKYYIESDNATGFVKKYKGGDFVFVAILPKDETVEINQFMSDMTGEDFEELLKSKTSDYDVYANMPCFTGEYSLLLNDSLKALGIERAFDEDDAEFKTMADLGEGHNIFVNRVIHKAYIELNEEGTKAGAATAVEMTDKCALEIDKEKYVNLDRPFAYAIVDTKTKLPIMIGTVNTLE